MIAGDDPGDVSPARSAALDAAWDDMSPEYVRGWKARQQDKPRKASESAEWLRGWDDCDNE